MVTMGYLVSCNTLSGHTNTEGRPCNEAIDGLEDERVSFLKLTAYMLHSLYASHM